MYSGKDRKQVRRTYLERINVIYYSKISNTMSTVKLFLPTPCVDYSQISHTYWKSSFCSENRDDTTSDR